MEHVYELCVIAKKQANLNFLNDALSTIKVAKNIATNISAQDYMELARIDGNIKWVMLWGGTPEGAAKAAKGIRKKRLH